MIDPGPAEQTMGGFKGRRNAQGRYVALGASVGDDGDAGNGGGSITFGTAALGGSASEIEHGADLTIETDGTYSLGVRSHAPQLHYQEGDQLWLSGQLTAIAEQSVADGAEITEFGAYDFAASNYLADRSDVFERSGFAYVHPVPGTSIRSPAGQGDPAVKTTNRAYWSYKVWQSSDIFRMITIGYTGITGTFYDGGPFTRGEEILITAADGTSTSTGRITFVDTAQQRISFEKDSGTIGRSSLTAGSTIEGLDSGAIADVTSGAGYENWNSAKRWRVETDAGNDDIQLRLTIGNTVVFRTLAGEFQPGGSRPGVPGSLRQNVAQWEQISGSIIAYGTETTARHRKNSSEEVYGPHALGQDASSITRGINFGPHISEYAPNSEGGHQFRHANPVYDDEPARVMLGNSATWGECTKTQDCLIKEWSSTRAVVRQNHGDFESADMIAAYIFNENDELISSDGLVLREGT